MPTANKSRPDTSRRAPPSRLNAKGLPRRQKSRSPRVSGPGVHAGAARFNELSATKPVFPAPVRSSRTRSPGRAFACSQLSALGSCSKQTLAEKEQPGFQLIRLSSFGPGRPPGKPDRPAGPGSTAHRSGRRRRARCPRRRRGRCARTPRRRGRRRAALLSVCGGGGFPTPPFLGWGFLPPRRGPPPRPPAGRPRPRIRPRPPGEPKGSKRSDPLRGGVLLPYEATTTRPCASFLARRCWVVGDVTTRR